MNRFNHYKLRFFFLTLLYLGSGPSFAHRGSDSYLQLNVSPGRVEGTWSIALRDLDLLVGLDENGDSALTWGEVKARKLEILQTARSHLVLSSSGPTQHFNFSSLSLDRLSDGVYCVLHFNERVALAADAMIIYSLLFDLDAQHRGITTITRSDNSIETLVFTPDRRELPLYPGTVSPPSPFANLVTEGIWHIWKGFDHVLFLLALLLPAVLRYKGGTWEVVPSFIPTLIEVGKVVTAFTLAHSITLSLSALRVLTIPSSVIEPIIAASVIVAALNNLWLGAVRHNWVFAFVFGLAHGFGFASVFTDLGLRGTHIVAPLFAFNLGVELGQVVIVLGFLPIAFLLRRTLAYRLVIFQCGSAGIALVATTWLIERIFNLKVLPF